MDIVTWMVIVATTVLALIALSSPQVRRSRARGSVRAANAKRVGKS